MPINRLSKNYQDNPRIPSLGIYIGFVKRNDDTQRMGRLSVFVPEFGGDPEDPGAWLIVSYASPFAGATDPTTISGSSQTMEGSQQSYGLWMVPPDLNNQVAVFFANGDLARGFWFACCYQQNMNHMIPGIATNVTTLPITPIGTAPVVEYNKANVASTTNPRRPRFDPLANGLLFEGLAGDNERGVSSTSARREAPSQVFGWLTPRGNTVHVDDNPANEFIRMRTRSGAQILIHETTGYVYINSKKGNSWIEISDAGVDIYTADSISMRAELDFNIRADRNINLDAGDNLHLNAGKGITLNAGQGISVKSGTDLELTAGRKLLSTSINTTEISVGTDYVVSVAGKGSLKITGDYLINAGKASLKTTNDYLIHSGGSVRTQAATDITELAGSLNARDGNLQDQRHLSPAVSVDDASAATVATDGSPSAMIIGDAKQTFSSTNTDQTSWRPGGRQVNTIVGRMPTHEPWREHPNGQVPPPPSENIEINAQGTYDAGSSSQTLPDGSLNDTGCSAGAANTKPISSEVFAAITNACSKTGADHATMLAFADIESSFQPGAAAGTSSATGLYQFTSGTWTQMVTKYGAQYNVAYNQINDPAANSLMGGQFIQDNASILKKRGIANPTAGQLYIMHFMGSGGGPALIEAAQKTPDQDASMLFPRPAGANPRIFRGKNCAQVVAALSQLADSKAQAYSGQYGLPPPCDRDASGSPAIPLAKAPDAPTASTPKPHVGTANLSGDSSTMLASLKRNPDGWVGVNRQCVSLVRSTGLPPTSQWTKGSTDPTTWAVGQPIAVFDNNGRYGNHSDGSSHAAIFVGIADTGNVHSRYIGRPNINVIDQWQTQPAHARTIWADPARGIVDNAMNYSAINLLT